MFQCVKYFVEASSDFRIFVPPICDLELKVQEIVKLAIFVMSNSTNSRISSFLGVEIVLLKLMGEQFFLVINVRILKNSNFNEILQNYATVRGKMKLFQKKVNEEKNTIKI